MNLGEDALLARLEALLGAAHVDAADGVEVLGETFGPAAAAAQPALARVRPDSVEALQALVGLAGEAGLALWLTPNACANGAHFGNPGKRALLVDLSRMNRIVDLDAASACALVEPGVSFAELRAHIETDGLPLWVDCDANGAHSVAGSIAARAFGYTPYGDRTLMQCGAEVVMADGGLMRTGMGALPGNDTWQLFKYNFGPYLDGLFSRSDFAAVAKIGLWLMPAPPAFHPFRVSLPDLAAVAAAVELLRPLRISMVVPNTLVIADAGSERALARAAGIDVGDVCLRKPWHLYGALYGLPENVAFAWRDLERALAALPGAELTTPATGSGEPLWEARSGLMRGRPAYHHGAPEPDRCVWFAASAPLEGDAARAMHTLVAETCAAHTAGFRASFALTWRTCLLQVEVPYHGTGGAPSDATADYATARSAALACAHALAGAGFPVTHDSADLTGPIGAGQTGAGLSGLLRRIGNTLDPQGVFGQRAG